MMRRCGAWPEGPCPCRDHGMAAERNRLRRRSSRNAARARLVLLRRKSVDQRQPIEALFEAPRKIVVPALALQPAALPDLLHGQALDQDVMHDGRAVQAKLALAIVEPEHRFALALGDRLARLCTIDIFTRGVDGLRSTLGPLPVVLEGTAGLVLRLVDLAVRMQTTQGIIANRTQGDDLPPRPKRKEIVTLNAANSRMERQIARAPVMQLPQPI